MFTGRRRLKRSGCWLSWSASAQLSSRRVAVMGDWNWTPKENLVLRDMHGDGWMLQSAEQDGELGGDRAGL
eukprot:1134713-Prorocentrum_lima.AAC.1